MRIISLFRRRISLSRKSGAQRLHLHFMSVISTFAGTVISGNEHDENPLCLWGRRPFPELCPIRHGVTASISLDSANDPLGRAGRSGAPACTPLVDREVRMHSGQAWVDLRFVAGLLVY